MLSGWSISRVKGSMAPYITELWMIVPAVKCLPWFAQMSSTCCFLCCQMLSGVQVNLAHVYCAKWRWVVFSHELYGVGVRCQQNSFSLWHGVWWALCLRVLWFLVLFYTLKLPCCLLGMGAGGDQSISFSAPGEGLSWICPTAGNIWPVKQVPGGRRAHR